MRRLTGPLPGAEPRLIEALSTTKRDAVGFVGLPEALPVPDQELLLIRAEPGLLAHFKDPRLPLGIGIGERAVKLVTAGTLRHFQLGCSAHLLRKQFPSPCQAVATGRDGFGSRHWRRIGAAE